MNKRSLASVLRWTSASLAIFLGGCNLEVLDPAGSVGVKETRLIYISLILMLIVVIPVIVLTLWFAWRYRSTNTKATYAPKWAHSTAIEVVVWAIPCVIIAILGTITWRTSHTLDPYQPLPEEANTKPLVIQAVSLDWKWLFIYPEQGVASVNELAIPTNVPVRFEITSDSVMNSFFIPRLGSQIYAMAGMETKVNLIANQEGTYPGLSANYSGAGFSDMHFDAIATSQQGFDDWIKKAKASSSTLDDASFHTLTTPSEKVPVSYYATVTPGLFGKIINQYMGNMSMKPVGESAASAQPVQHDQAKAAE